MQSKPQAAHISTGWRVTGSGRLEPVPQQQRTLFFAFSNQLSQLYFAFLISFASLATERFSAMVEEEAIQQKLQPDQPDRPLRRRKAPKHAPPRVSPAARHSAQPSPTAGSQPEVLERLHTDRGDSPAGDPTGAAPAVVLPAIEAGPLSQQPSTPLSSSGVEGPSAGPPSASKMQLTQRLSPVKSYVASTGKLTLVLPHNANVGASQPVLVQPQSVDPIGQQQPATVATQGASLSLHKQLLFLEHQTFLKQFLYERNQHKSLGSLKTLSKLNSLQYTLSEALEVAVPQTATSTSTDNTGLLSSGQTRAIHRLTADSATRKSTADLRTYEVQLHIRAGVPHLAATPSDEPDPVHWEQFFF
ncbi:hypothetical protein Esti_002844 [Eimeria stiedai]